MQAIRHREVSVNGERLRLHVAETESRGPLVLLLQGFPEFWYAWRDYLADPGRDHHAAAPDTRGTNLSTGPEAVEGYRIEALVEDVRRLVAALGHERCVLVGHDRGGFAAWETAIRHPELVGRLVVVNTAQPGVFDAMLC